MKQQQMQNAQGIFINIDHVLGHQTSFNKFERLQVMQSVFSNQNVIKLEINSIRISGVPLKAWELNDVCNPWIKEKKLESILT